MFDDYDHGSEVGISHEDYVPHDVNPMQEQADDQVQADQKPQQLKQQRGRHVPMSERAMTHTERVRNEAETESLILSLESDIGEGREVVVAGDIADAVTDEHDPLHELAVSVQARLLAQNDVPQH